MFIWLANLGFPSLAWRKIWKLFFSPFEKDYPQVVAGNQENNLPKNPFFASFSLAFFA